MPPGTAPSTRGTPFDGPGLKRRSGRGAFLGTSEIADSPIRSDEISYADGRMFSMSGMGRCRARRPRAFHTAGPLRAPDNHRP